MSQKISYSNLKLRTVYRLLPLLILSLLIPSSLSDPTCLLSEPLTDSCINSITMDQLTEKKTSVYLCVIAHQRKLYKKAEEFCQVAAEIEAQSGYRFMEDLAQNGKWLKCFKKDYYLFFEQPFRHEKAMNSSLVEITKAAEKPLEENSKPSNFQKAIKAFYANDLAKSLSSLEQALKQSASDEDRNYQHFLMLRILEKESKLYEGLNYVIKALNEGTKVHPYLQHLQGNFEMHHVQFKKALESFQRAHLMFKNDLNFPLGFSFTHYNLGLCYQKIGDFDKAIIAYQESHKVRNNAESLNAIGHSYFSKALLLEEKSKKADLEIRKNYLAKSEQFYFRALEQEVSYYLAHYNLGVYYLEIQKYQKALDSFQKALEYSPGFTSAKYGLIKALHFFKNIEETKKVAKIHELIQQIMKEDDKEVELTGLLYSIGDHSKSLQIISRTANQKQSPLIEWKAMNYFAQQKYEHAVEAFKQAIFLGSKTPEIYFNLGYCQQNANQISEAIQSYETAYKMEKREETLERLKALKKSSSAQL